MIYRQQELRTDEQQDPICRLRRLIPIDMQVLAGSELNAGRGISK